VSVFFVAGTDTDVGKTFVACALLTAANERGLSTAAVKPIAAGCESTPEGLRNEDALALQEAMSLDLPYQQVNPVAFEPPIAPHIAAARVGKSVSADRLLGFCRGVIMKRADFTLIEGAGGWRVPLNARETLAKLPVELKVPVILVVGMKLGCINHAILTAEAIRRDGLQLAGWVANTPESEMSCYEENIETLKSLMPCPCLGEIPRLEGAGAEQAAQYLSIDTLLSSL
jgi:dethiobiotin synthetase